MSSARSIPNHPKEQTWLAFPSTPQRCRIGERYKLLTGLVIPRPIAFVTSMSPAGVINAAPFSFFNLDQR